MPDHSMTRMANAATAAKGLETWKAFQKETETPM